jgi:hypothetical protein
MWRQVRTKWWQSQKLTTADDMYAMLRRRSAYEEYTMKSDGVLVSTTWYETPGGGHSYDNALFCHGSILDINHADMLPDDLAKTLPDIEMLCVSSWSYRLEDARYRVYIPTTTAMPPGRRSR